MNRDLGSMAVTPVFVLLPPAYHDSLRGAMAGLQREPHTHRTVYAHRIPHIPGALQMTSQTALKGASESRRPRWGSGQRRFVKRPLESRRKCWSATSCSIAAFKQSQPHEPQEATPTSPHFDGDLLMRNRSPDQTQSPIAEDPNDFVEARSDPIADKC